MTLESQVISLPLAKRLKELGLKQQSWFFWIRLRDRNAESEWEVVYANDKRLQKPDLYEWYNAFTVAELGEMLPSELNKHGWENWNNQFESFRHGKHWVVQYRAGDLMASAQKSQTEADARAKMLIYLIENNLMSV